MSEDQIEDEIQEDDGSTTRKRRRRRNLVGPARPVTTWKDGVVPYVFNLDMSKF